MYCPRCGQGQNSPETRFCSRCGFLMTGVNQLLANDGNLSSLAAPKFAHVDTPRKKGMKKGVFIFLLSFLIVPLVAILTLAAGAEPYAVVISAILLTAGGLLRAAYAWMFESNVAPENAFEHDALPRAGKFFHNKRNAQALPPQQSIPVETYVPPSQGSWRDTNDLTPSSVTESTTKLLENEK